MARPPTYEEEELLEKAWQIQGQNPTFSEGAVCGCMGVGREYLASRSKTSLAIRELRERMNAVRQAAWEKVGLELIKQPSKETNPVVFIWMTRNVLGWRNEPAADASQPKELTDEGAVSKPISGADYLLELKRRRELETQAEKPTEEPKE